MANKDIEYTVHDYGPLNKAIDENLRIKRTRSVWGYAKSVALILIALGIFLLLLAWAYSLLNKHYILKRVAGVQERVIEEKINEAVSSSGISKATDKLKMLGDNQMEIEKLGEAEEKLGEAEEELTSEKEKKEQIQAEKEVLEKQMINSKNELEQSVGKLDTFKSEKLALLNEMESLKNQLKDLEGKSEAKDEILKQLEELKKKNENIKNSYYLFSEENIEVKNKKVRVMTRFYFKDPDSNKPTSVDCYVDFAPSYGVKLADLELGGKDEDFSFDAIYKNKNKRFSKKIFEEVKKNHCIFLN